MRSMRSTRPLASRKWILLVALLAGCAGAVPLPDEDAAPRRDTGRDGPHPDIFVWLDVTPPKKSPGQTCQTQGGFGVVRCKRTLMTDPWVCDCWNPSGVKTTDACQTFMDNPCVYPNECCGE